ncbi:MAG: tRNA (guanosine(37)-N1)-methyltransferase TrmD [Dongiaceae bacterium]
MSWTATILTLFPEMLPGPLGHSLAGQALQKGLWRLDVKNIRDFAPGKHQSVDDTPFGGGAGMVLKPDVIDAALQNVKNAPGPKIYLSPRGTPFTQKLAEEWAKGPGVTMLCGRYEGVDQRALDKWQLQEVSLGDFILSGGELAALSMLDASIRLLPGVMGKEESLTEESLSNGLLEYPHYTKPREWEGKAVPEVLLSGHHGQIEAWRKSQAEALTKERRPDLWALYQSRKNVA